MGKRLPKGFGGGRSATAALAGSLEIHAEEMLEELEFGVGQDRSGAGCVEEMSEKEEWRTGEKDMEANEGMEKRAAVERGCQ